MKQTKITEVEAQVKSGPVEQTRARGSMADIERIHGTAPVDPAAVKAKAGKQRIDPAAHGVHADDEGGPAPVPTARTINGRKGGGGGRKPAEPKE